MTVKLNTDPKNYFVVLGAGTDQTFMIRCAQELGFKVLAFDYDPEAIGFKQADHYAIISTRDTDKLKSYLEAFQEKGNTLAGISTMGSEISEIIACLTHHFDLPGISQETAFIGSNKLAMKERFKERNIPIPQFKKIDTEDELAQFAQSVGYPVIIKPVDRSGARGVFYIEDPKQIPKLFQQSKSLSFINQVMVEEYLSGPQISTETLLTENQSKTPGFADRNYDDASLFHPNIIENGGWTPSRLPNGTREKIEKLVETASRALGVKRGTTKGDVVLTEDGPKIIEMAVRLSGGDFSESLVPLGSGVNYIHSAIRIATGHDPEFENLEPKFKCFVANRYFFPPSGKLTAIHGIDTVQNLPWVEKLDIYVRPGEKIEPASNHATRAGVFIVTSPNLNELEERIKMVYETISFQMED